MFHQASTGCNHSGEDACLSQEAGSLPYLDKVISTTASVRPHQHH